MSNLNNEEQNLKDGIKELNFGSTDEADASSAMEEFHLMLSLDAMKQQRKIKKSVPFDWDGATCYECGEDLPVNRLKDGEHLCVECKCDQDRIEKMRKMKRI